MSAPPAMGPAGEPTLPALLRSRHGIPPYLTLLALAALAAGLLAAVLLRNAGGGTEALFVAGPPAFSVLYDDDHVRAVPPVGKELARLEGRRGIASLTVTPLPGSPLPFGGLPVFAERHLAVLAREHDRLRVRSEGKAAIRGAPGYRVVYRAGRGRDRVQGQDVLLYPDATALRGGALLRFTQARRGRGSRAAVNEVRSVMRSFEFGRDRR